MTGNDGKFRVSGKTYSYEAKRTLDITINENDQEPTVLSSEVFDLPVNAKTYTLEYDEVLSNRKQTLASMNDNFTGKDAYACKMQGKFTLSISRRYFNNSITFNRPPCSTPNETLKGVGLLDADNELVVIGKNINKRKGIFFSNAE